MHPQGSKAKDLCRLSPFTTMRIRDKLAIQLTLSNKRCSGTQLCFRSNRRHHLRILLDCSCNSPQNCDRQQFFLKCHLLISKGLYQILLGFVNPFCQNYYAASTTISVVSCITSYYRAIKILVASRMRPHKRGMIRSIVLIGRGEYVLAGYFSHILGINGRRC